MTRRGDGSLEKEAFWKLAVDEWRAARTSIREFCRSNGLKESAFYFWRRELAKRAGATVIESGTRKAGKPRAKPQAEPAQSPTAMFLPLTLRSQETEAAGDSDSRSIEIVAGSHRLRVPPGFDEETLSRLLRLLGPVRPGSGQA
jgi:transposase-like protein